MPMTELVIEETAVGMWHGSSAAQALLTVLTILLAFMMFAIAPLHAAEIIESQDVGLGFALVVISPSTKEVHQNADLLDRLRTLARKGPITLVNSAHDEVHNDSVELRDLLLGR